MCPLHLIQQVYQGGHGEHGEDGLMEHLRVGVVSAPQQARSNSFHVLVPGARAVANAALSAPPGIRLAYSMAAAKSSLPCARSPARMPARSASERFWLIFHLPSMRAIGISMPTMPLSIVAR
jgi:hypothetical protein